MIKKIKHKIKEAVNSFGRIEHKTFANDFFTFLTCEMKNRTKKTRLFEIGKKRKIRILEQWGSYRSEVNIPHSGGSRSPMPVSRFACRTPY